MKLQYPFVAVSSKCILKKIIILCQKLRFVVYARDKRSQSSNFFFLKNEDLISLFETVKFSVMIKFFLYSGIVLQHRNHLRNQVMKIRFHPHATKRRNKIKKPQMTKMTLSRQSRMTEADGVGQGHVIVSVMNDVVDPEIDTEGVQEIDIGCVLFRHEDVHALQRGIPVLLEDV